jgi:hypothetical protein
MSVLKRKFRQPDGPTWLVALALYSGVGRSRLVQCRAALVSPTLPWYDIPRFYRENRAALLESNGQFVYKGYAELARRYFLTPVFSPVHPTHPGS